MTSFTFTITVNGQYEEPKDVEVKCKLDGDDGEAPNEDTFKGAPAIAIMGAFSALQALIDQESNIQNMLKWQAEAEKQGEQGTDAETPTAT